MYAVHMDDIIHTLAAFSELFEVFDWLNEIFSTKSPTKDNAETEYIPVTKDNEWEGNPPQQTPNNAEQGSPKYKETSLSTTTCNCSKEPAQEGKDLQSECNVTPSSVDTVREVNNPKNVSRVLQCKQKSSDITQNNECNGNLPQRSQDIIEENIPNYENTLSLSVSTANSNNEVAMETNDLQSEFNITSSNVDILTVNDAKNTSTVLQTQGSYCSFVSLDFRPPSPNSNTHREKMTEDNTNTSISNGHQKSMDENSGENLINSVKMWNQERNNRMEYTISATKNQNKKTESNNNDAEEICSLQKFTTYSWNLLSVMESLYRIQDPAYKHLQANDNKFERKVFILSQGAFCEYSDGIYTLSFHNSSLNVTQDSHILLSITVNYASLCKENTNVLKLDNRMGRCLYFKCDSENDLTELKEEIELQCLKYRVSECIKLVHYPLKYHQNVIIIDLGSCSTRAGILMDQPTLPSIFFPTVCATDKLTGKCTYGMEALHPEVRQNSNLSFPVRPSAKIIKHTLDIDLLGGLFMKIFNDLNVDPTQYRVQLSLPRSLSINAQSALVKLLLEDLKVEAISLTNQALLTLYAHDVTSAVVVDIGDRMDILSIVDGFIVENGVTRLPYGGQRLIHHMKHALAEKHLSFSNDIDSFIVQYITENIAYVAEDYENEIYKASKHPESVQKRISLQTFTWDGNVLQDITLGEARFKIPEGLFNPELWGLDSPGVHHLVQKAIAATGVDARKQLTENIYVSGGVTLLPGFIERLNKEVTKLNKTTAIPKVYASNYRYHCTYIGACKFARMEVFPQVCVTSKEYNENGLSSLKKFVLCF